LLVALLIRGVRRKPMQLPESENRFTPFRTRFKQRRRVPADDKARPASSPLIRRSSDERFGFAFSPGSLGGFFGFLVATRRRRRTGWRIFP
jgi:hypothetical protein